MKSVNLSQAVMILCYEIFVGHAGPLEEFTPRMASSEELEGMYEQMKTVLMNIGFLHPQNPDHWMMHIRRFLGRTKLFSKEVKIIRGICRQLDWSMRNKKT
jgi:tRNA/rRNA methyltransferase